MVINFLHTACQKIVFDRIVDAKFRMEKQTHSLFAVLRWFGILEQMLSQCIFYVSYGYLFLTVH